MRSTPPRFSSRFVRIATTVGLVAGVLAFNAPSAGAASATSVSAGSVHACVLTPTGGAKCWGYNGVGTIGDGTKKDRRAPVAVSGLGSGVSDVQAVWDHSCALTTGGGVKCWGHNGDGELGDGTLRARLEPVNVTGLTSGVVAITLGFDSGCALTTGGGVKCWGYNGNGQLGDGTRTTRLEPVNVFGLSSGVAAIAGGWDHTCALMNSGGVKCWGNNAHGEVGDGTKIDRLKPVDVFGLTSGIDAISTGFDHTCAITTGGAAKCWGNNSRGELGDGSLQQRRKPVNVVGLGSGVASISAGFNHTCVVTTGGGAKCWGNNDHGQVGDGSTNTRRTPVNVYRLTGGVSQISAAGGYKKTDFTCATLTTGKVKCWGSNGGAAVLEPIDSHGGQLGDGTRFDRYIPSTVRRLTGANAKNYRPDVAISKFSGGGYAGDNIYNKSGNNQTRSTQIGAGHTTRFYVRLQNDAAVTDSFFLWGPSSNADFVVTYSSGGQAITGRVVSGAFWTTLNPGATKTIVMTVQARSTASAGTVRAMKFVARSAGDSGKLDVVKAIVSI